MKTEPNNAALWRELNRWIEERTEWGNTEGAAREFWSEFLNGHTLVIISRGCGVFEILALKNK